MKDNKEIKLTDMTENNISYSKEKINIYLFYGEGCPHCEELKNYLITKKNHILIFTHLKYGIIVQINNL